MWWLGLMACGWAPLGPRTCEQALVTPMQRLEPGDMLRLCASEVPVPVCRTAIAALPAVTAEEGLNTIGPCVEALCADQPACDVELTPAVVAPSTFRSALERGLVARGVSERVAFPVVYEMVELAVPRVAVPIVAGPDTDPLWLRVGPAAGRAAVDVAVPLSGPNGADTTELNALLATFEPDPALLEVHLHGTLPPALNTWRLPGALFVACHLQASGGTTGCVPPAEGVPGPPAAR